MKILFHRSSTIEVKVQKPDATRVFVFDVQAGFSRGEPQVDPLSGMLMNLVEVDLMLAALANLWQQQKWSSLKALLEKSKEHLEGLAQNHKVSLEELCLMEKRGFWLKWRSGQLLMGQEHINEVEGGLYRLRFEGHFDESVIEQQSLQYESFEELFSERVFLKNPKLVSLDIENIASLEKWSLHKV